MKELRNLTVLVVSGSTGFGQQRYGPAISMRFEGRKEGH